MDLRFLKQYGSNAPGDLHPGFHPGAAAELVRRGIAEAATGAVPVSASAAPVAGAANGKKGSQKRKAR